MKKILSIVLCSAALCVSALAQLGTNTTPAVGATGGVVSTVINGGTNYVAASTTGTYTAAVPVAQHANVGIGLTYNCNPGATNGNVIVTLAKSYDNGNTYETTPSIKLTNALPTAVQFAANSTNWVALYDLSVPNATHLEVVSIQNTASGGPITNLAVYMNLNNNTVWTVPAQR